MSGLDSKKEYHSIVNNNTLYNIYANKKQENLNEIKNFKLQPNLALRMNPNFVQYITENIIVLVSGCNIIFYNFIKFYF